MERAYLVQSLKRYSTKRTERTKIGKVHLVLIQLAREPKNDTISAKV